MARKRPQQTSNPHARLATAVMFICETADELKADQEAGDLVGVSMMLADISDSVRVAREALKEATPRAPRRAAHGRHKR